MSDSSNCEPRPACSVAVRVLCDFTARQGDLDLRFTPAPSGLEGILGHAAVRARRGAEYQCEVALSGQYQSLAVRGRADGYDPVRQQLEEIKTHRSDLERMPDNQRQLHWAQARTYAWLICEKLGLAEIRIALVYFNIVTQKETLLVESRSAQELQFLFEDQCRRYLYWAQMEAQHRSERDAQLARLAFTHASFRPGQRELAENVYKAALSGRPLLAQAPTGIGKTIGTLFPMLKAMPGQQLDKLYCLSAKTSGRSLMVDALQRVKQQAPALPLRVLELVARDKACEHPDKACHGESCPLAKGFYDRLPAARRDAAQAGMLNQQALRAIGLAHEICPYYLGQEMARWSDVIAGDYNYYFDLGAMLHGMAQQSGWRTAVLVDEAHNLLERGRKMYSAELDPASLREAQLAAPAQLAKVLARVDRQWLALAAGFEGDYAICDLPDKLLLALQQAVSAITDLLSEQAAALGPALQRFYFDALHFTRVAELFDHHSQFDLTRPEHAASRRPLLCLRNLIPAPFLRPRFGAAQACVLFSATLSPWHFYADTLGLPDTTAWVDIAPAFRPEQLAVKIVTDVSTRYADRDASLAPIAALIGAQFMQAPGNYLAFFSSYDYLQKALAAFRAAWPAVPVWEQQRRMDETARNAFLARFVEDGQGIGFAVLGGVFGEGIDLPGTRLVGAFIATLGLPQVNPVNEALSACMAQRFGASVAYDYTYFFPGLQKVVQAAGRVIRNESDRGVLMLIDDRYARADARALYPSWWRLQKIRAGKAGEQAGAPPAEAGRLAL